METNGTSRSRWLAIFPPAAIGLLMIGQLLTPTGLDQPIRSLTTARSELAVAASHADRLYVATCFILLGLGVMAVAFGAIATLCRPRGSATAVVAVALAGLASLCGVVTNSLVGLNLAGAAKAGAALRDPAARVLFIANTTTPPTVAILAYVAGLATASVVMAVALWQAATPRWLAVLFPVTMIVGSVSPPGFVGMLVSVPFALVTIALAQRIWRSAGADAPAAPLAHVIPPAIATTPTTPEWRSLTGHLVEF